MFHDTKPSASSTKGKAKEETHWQSGWWDFFPLIEQAQRPVAWTSSSSILTSHPTQPLIVARMLSSSKQFVVPSPPPVLASLGSYDPPTIISVSPSDDWLFSYFPGRDRDGTGCLWRKGLQLDSWTVKEWWNFPRGDGVVTTSWAGPPREWVVSDTIPTRLPPRGPPTPTTSPTLLLVTENQCLSVCYFRNYASLQSSSSLPPSPPFQIVRCSLTRSGMTFSTQPNPVHETMCGPGGIKNCFSAAIGLAYSESSILVAMRSRLLPAPSVKPSSSFNPMDLSIPLDISEHILASLDSVPCVEWESWGEESTIELCEVQLVFDRMDDKKEIGLALAVNTLPPLHQPHPHLTQLTFVCTPPFLDVPAPESPTKSDLGISQKMSEIGHIYLAASFLDINDFFDNSPSDISTPTSQLILYSLSRITSSSPSSRPSWISHQESARTFSSSVLAFFTPYLTPTTPHDTVLHAGVLHTSGIVSTTKPKKREAPIGQIEVLKLPTLENHGKWEPSFIMSSKDRIGEDLPLSAVLSANKVLLCSASSSIASVQTSVHLLPRYCLESSTSSSTLLPAVVTALYSRNSTADITHILSLPSTPVGEVAEIIYGALSIGSGAGIPTTWIWEVLGVAVEVYREKALRAENDADRQSLIGRWQVAHNICSLAACTMAFEDCKESEVYDLEAVWQLVGLSGWCINFLETLMKECVLFSSTVGAEQSHGDNGDDLFGSGSSSPSFGSHFSRSPKSTMLHLVQPYALGNLCCLLNHVKQFRAFLGTLTASEVNAQIARDILVDLVDCSGIDLDLLQSMLGQLLEDAKTAEADESRRALALCMPTPAMEASLRKVVHKLMNSSVIDKPRLFIKPSDLVDGISQLSLVNRSGKIMDKDVVTKGLLVKRGLICLRCGGRSDVGGEVAVAGHLSLRWRAWEKMWTTRCICGGYWTS